MEKNYNSIQNNANKQILNSEDILGKTLTQTQILSQSKINLLNDFINKYQVVKGEEFIINKNDNKNIPAINNKNDIPNNAISINDIYIIYNYQNFNDKFMKKNGKIIDNIDMNNETEFTYESKKKIMNENNLVSKSIKMINSNNINQENKVEQMQNDQKSNNSQKIYYVSQIEPNYLKNNTININATNQIHQINQKLKPISVQANRSYDQNKNKAFPLNLVNKPKENIIYQKNNEIHQDLPKPNFDNIDYSKIQTKEQSRRILSMMEFNSTVESHLIEVNKKENNTNDYVDLHLSFPKVPIQESAYELA